MRSTVLDVRRRPEPPPPLAEDPAVDPSIASLARYRRDCERLAQQLHEDHPEVSLATLSALIDGSSDELADARVQAFKLILVERAVRRRLADTARSTRADCDLAD